MQRMSLKIYLSVKLVITQERLLKFKMVVINFVVIALFHLLGEECEVERVKTS